MANLGEKLSFGDLEGVVTRAVKVAGGTEYTVVVPDEDSARPVSHPAQDVSAAEIVTEGTPQGERLLDVDKDDEENRRAEADKAAADRKAAADKAAADRKAAAGRKAGDTK